MLSLAVNSPTTTTTMRSATFASPQMASAEASPQKSATPRAWQASCLRASGALSTEVRQAARGTARCLRASVLDAREKASGTGLSRPLDSEGLQMPRDAGSGLLAHYQDVLLLAKFFAKSVPRSIAMANTDAGVLLPAAASPHLDLCPGVWADRPVRLGECGRCSRCNRIKRAEVAHKKSRSLAAPALRSVEVVC